MAGNTIFSHTINNYPANNVGPLPKFFLAQVYSWKFLRQIKISLGYPTCLCWSALWMCPCCKPHLEDVSMTSHSPTAWAEGPPQHLLHSPDPSSLFTHPMCYNCVSMGHTADLLTALHHFEISQKARRRGKLFGPYSYYGSKTPTKW